MMIEGPLENVVASLEATMRRKFESEVENYLHEIDAAVRTWATRAEAERERRLRIIRNLPRNRHAWKGKR